MALASSSVEQLEYDPLEQPRLGGWVKVKRSDVLLGASFERRWAQLYSNRIEFWKSKETAESRPRGTPKDAMGLHLLRRLRYLDHAPGSSKTQVIELYSHARTLYLQSDDDTAWQTWMHQIDDALRNSSFDFRDDAEKERDLYAGTPPPPGAYTPRSDGTKDTTSETLATPRSPHTPRTPRTNDPLLEFIKGKKPLRSSSSRSNTPVTSPRSPQKTSSSTLVSKTPRALDSPKRTDNRDD